MRRLLLLSALVVLVANVVVLAAELGPVAEREVAARGTSTTTTPAVRASSHPDFIERPVSTTTTTLAPPPPPPAPAQPVNPPKNAYASEPQVVIGTIEIPKLGLSVPLNQGISLRTIDRGPSHWPGTALPGQNGNVVVAGHRVTKTRPFRHIDQLVPGDEVIFTTNEGRHVYHVTGHEVVTPDAMRIVAQTPEPTGTLFACHPPGSARYRYVVYLALAGT